MRRAGLGKKAHAIAKMVRHRATDLFGDASRGRRLEAIRRAVVFNVRTRLLRRPTHASIGTHSKVIAYPGESNSPLAAYHNPPNRYQMKFWRSHLRPGDLFIDIGANVGIYTIFALDLGAKVTACEPDPHNYQRLLEHLKLNAYEAETFNVALADRPGTLRLTQGLDSLNHLLFDNTSEGIEVEVTTLDAVVGDRLAAGVKIDVEGTESLVLAGGTRALSEGRIDVIQFEWGRLRRAPPHTALPPAPEILRDFAYTVCRFDDTGALVPIVGEVKVSPEKRFRDLFAFSPDCARKPSALARA